ncbi:MAG: hypothetical protein EOO20_11790 [Chryseobacterium sp.]|nr:MAG: hypothetical protein EOO20_11790 [Chryseobacterium sp.]
MPKKIVDPTAGSRIITNKRTADRYDIERSLVFIDVPIEVHLLTVLWILDRGYRLDAKLPDSCLGNRLLLKKDKTGVVQGSGMFKPYQKQYHNWRDGAVNCAKGHLENGTDVMLLNLDIRDFFYSVRIPRDEIFTENVIAEYRPLQHVGNMVTLFGRIHEEFTAMLAGDLAIPYPFLNEVIGDDGRISQFILPIGLLSSFVLANQHLTDFDNRILRKAKPAYYGRYVDDILMVLVNPAQPANNSERIIPGLNFNFGYYHADLHDSTLYSQDEYLSETDYDELYDLEKVVLENFYPIISLVDMPGCLTRQVDLDEDQKSDRERLFKINGYERLYCQSEKTLLYYFDKDESSLVIDKLKRDLEEKSSEFRNYEDADDGGDFEESAYHLLYDGADGKIRTLKDYREDRFGLTVYLTKKIYNTLRQTEKINDQEAEKIIRFFKGKNALALYTLWERVFVYLLVNDKPRHFTAFYFNCIEALLAMEPPGGISVSEHKFREGGLKYLHCAFDLTISLNPSFLGKDSVAQQSFEFLFNTVKDRHPLLERKSTFFDLEAPVGDRYRRSNMVRHHFVAQPLMSYTIDKENLRNLTSIKLDY